jgi:hypothetical protein
MTADIIDLRASAPVRPGNGAREALIEVAETLPNTSREDAEKWADWVLAEYWLRGFKVVPIE